MGLGTESDFRSVEEKLSLAHIGFYDQNFTSWV